jgi:hypothetical protein
MKRGIYIIYISVVAWLAGNCVALAQPRFVPDQEIMKLGEVQFQTPRNITFGFANKGNRSLKIKEVKPSCGCTTVKFPTDDIKAGEHGQIVATYDAGMLGTFYKELAVYTNYREEPFYLTMQGTVVTDVQDWSGEYPINLGNVSLLSNYIEFDNVNKGDRPVAELHLVNTEHTAFKPELMHLPPYLTAQAVPENIPAGKPGIIYLTLDSEKLADYGLTQTNIYLARYLGDKVSETNEILVSAVLLPDFSNLTQTQLDNAPMMELSSTQLDMGQMGAKKKLTETVMVTNTGKSALEIKKVQVFNKALTVSLSNRTLAPGKSAKLKISAVASYMKQAKSRPRVLLISDDPRNPLQTINVNVEE